MATLENLMAQLADSTKNPAASQLARLSDLSLPDARRLEELWPGLGVVRRRQVVRQLVAEAEAKVEVNFDRVFKICLKDSDEAVRAKAIEGLWECHELSLVETLIALLETDPAHSVRAAAAKALGTFALLAELGKLRPRYQALLRDPLLRLMEDNSQPLDVRRQALESVSYFSQERVVDAIERAYQDSDPDLKISALRAMGRNLDPRWLETLLSELSSPQVELRLEAARACGDLGDEKAVLNLAEMTEDEDSEVRLAAVHALGQIGGRQAVRALTNLLQHPVTAMRKAAKEALEEAQFSGDAISLPL
ncbi:MAG: HEAT repeat domain-containing protein [Chloroflexi bacterium]|nr:HEAT repeat domain-containing protein [Chloroflexota bacterium]